MVESQSSWDRKPIYWPLGILGSEYTVGVSKDTVAFAGVRIADAYKKGLKKKVYSFPNLSLHQIMVERTRGSMIDHHVTHRVKFRSQL